MNILVTGGIGKIGRAVIQRLITHDHTVLSVDRLPETEVEDAVQTDIAGARYQSVDITDYAALRPHFEGIDAVVHMAALVHPGAGSGYKIFHINAVGSFNVYQAAAEAGIKRVVSASSINALGFNFGVKPSSIQYFPIDEEHPNVTTDAYSFTKCVLEDTADYFWRRNGISGVSLRFPGVYTEHHRAPNPEHEARRKWFTERLKQTFAALDAMPEAERKVHVQNLITEFDRNRENRIREKPPEEQRRYYEALRARGKDMPLGAMLVWGRTNFWTDLDVRDAAQAVEKGLRANYEGSHSLFVNASQNTLGVPSAKLTAYAFPEVTEYKHPFEGTETLVSIDKARKLIGFEPEYQRQRLL